ncbi:MAG: type II toxin-antitoxin system Phd/YefM family antitoxin [Thermomicrobiales bacterium]
MRTVSLSEARAKFGSLLDAAARGEEITVTRYGVPVAMLVPPMAHPSDPDAAVDALLKFREGMTLGGLSIREIIEIEEGRK